MFLEHELVYIGQSRRVATRIEQHRKKEVHHDHALMIPCKESISFSLEKVLIKLLSPPENKKVLPVGRLEAIHALEFIGLHGEDAIALADLACSDDTDRLTIYSDSLSLGQLAEASFSELEALETLGAVKHEKFPYTRADEAWATPHESKRRIHENEMIDEGWGISFGSLLVRG